MSDEAAIEDFWAWWRANAEPLERAIEDGTVRDWVGPLGARVKAIHPGLDWELGAGRTARHYFCVSAKGDPTLRVIAERWRSAGPPDGPVFELHPARPGGGFGPQAVFDFGAASFPVADFRFAIEPDEMRERVHVEVWHPSFDAAPDELRGTATFIALDAALGEDEVERWIGAVDLCERPPAGSVDFAGLEAAIAALCAGATGERFAVLRGALPSGAPVFVSANLALKRVDHLLMDAHVELSLALRDPTPDGLTTDREAEALDDAEDALLDALGPDAIYVGRETAAGTRTIHLHAAHGGPALGRIDAWARTIDWPLDVRSAHDPGWEILRRW